MAPDKPPRRWVRDLKTPEATSEVEHVSSEREYVSQGLKQKGTPYEDYLRLLQDSDLWALMHIPFSAQLADFTWQASPPTMPSIEPGFRPSAEQVGITGAPSTDEAIIDEAIARELDKPPSKLVPLDYANVTKLDLSFSRISDLTPLKGLPSLQWLSLNQTQVSDVQVKSLQEALPKLEICSGRTMPSTAREPPRRAAAWRRPGTCT